MPIGVSEDFAESEGPNASLPQGGAQRMAQLQREAGLFAFGKGAKANGQMPQGQPQPGGQPQPQPQGQAPAQPPPQQQRQPFSLADPVQPTMPWRRHVMMLARHPAAGNRLKQLAMLAMVDQLQSEMGRGQQR